MKTFLAALALSVLATPAFADDEIKRADEYYVSLFGDATVRPDEQHNPLLERSYAADLRIGYKAEHHWGYEVRGFYGKLDTTSPAITTGNRSGIGGDALYRLGSLLGIQPYVLAGIGIAYSDALNGPDWIAPYANAGVGLSTGSLIELWQRPLRLRAEVRWAYEDYRDEYTGAKQFDDNNYVDLHTFVGIEFGLTRHVPTPPPPPPQVVPVDEQKPQ